MKPEQWFYLAGLALIASALTIAGYPLAGGCLVAGSLMRHAFEIWLRGNP